jgi:hypothetical protein
VNAAAGAEQAQQLRSEREARAVLREQLLAREDEIRELRTALNRATLAEAEGAFARRRAHPFAHEAPPPTTSSSSSSSSSSATSVDFPHEAPEVSALRAENIELRKCVRVLETALRSSHVERSQLESEVNRLRKLAYDVAARGSGGVGW